MNKPSVNFIGCGKLGKTIAKILKEKDIADIVGIINSSLEGSHMAAQYIGVKKVFEKFRDLPKANIYFITTGDDLIEEIAVKLALEHDFLSESIILHCSGSLSSDELNKLRELKCYAASVHPIKSFANPDQAISTFEGTFCAIEGDKEATSVLTPLFEKMGGVMLPIKKESKKIYHAGGIMGNNYLVTLHFHAMQCYINAGIDEVTAKKIVSMLMNDALNNLTHLSHDKALTGPLQRGDSKTVLNHILSMQQSSLSKETYDIYLSLGRGTLPLIKHNQAIKEILTSMFHQFD